MKKMAKMLVFLWLFIFLGFFTQVSAQTSPNIGILVIAHGSPNKDWNRYVEWAVEVKTGEATSEEIKQFQQLRSSLQYQLLWAWDLESLFNFEISDI